MNRLLHAALAGALIKDCGGLDAALEAEIADNVSKAVAWFEKFAGIRMPGDVSGQRKDLESQIDAIEHPSLMGALSGKMGHVGLLSSPEQKAAALAKLKGQLNTLNVQEVLDKLGDQVNAGGSGVPRQLISAKEKKPKKGPTDETDDLDKTAKDEADDAAKDLATAQAALVKTIMAHADAEKKAVDAETTKKLTDLAAEEVKIRKSKNDAHKAQQLALNAAAQSDTRSAAEAKKQLIDREAAIAADKAYEEVQDHINQTMSSIAEIMASMATTAAARNAIERRNLLANQARELTDFDLETGRNQTAGMYEGPEGQAALEQRMSERRQQVNLQSAQRQQQSYQQAGPLAQYTRGLSADLDQTGEKLMVSSLQQMNAALEQGLTNWRNFGQAAKSAVKSVLDDMIRLSLEKAELAAAPGVSGLFSSAASGLGGLFRGATNGAGSWLSGMWGGAHAAGGTIPAGKIGLVGEKGPELAEGGSSGTAILPHDLTAGLMAGIAGSARPSVGQQNLTIHEHYNLAGTVSEQDVMGMINRGRQQTLAQAASAFKTGFGSQLAAYNALEA